MCFNVDQPHQLTQEGDEEDSDDRGEQGIFDLGLGAPLVAVSNVDVPPSPSKSPRRAAYQKVKSIADLSTYSSKGDPSKGGTATREDSRENSFSDLMKFRKQGTLPSTSSHSDDITLESILMEQQEQLRHSRHAPTEAPRQSSVPQAPLRRDQEQKEEDDSTLMNVERAKHAIALFEKNVEHWITVFNIVPLRDFERAVMGELLSLVAVVPVCANYIFWVGFCNSLERRLSIPVGSRVLQILRRVHPFHTLPPLPKKKGKLTSASVQSSKGGSPGRGAGRGHGGRGGGRGSGTGRGRRGGRGVAQNRGREPMQRGGGSRHESGLRRPSGDT